MVVRVWCYRGVLWLLVVIVLALSDAAGGEQPNVDLMFVGKWNCWEIAG